MRIALLHNERAGLGVYTGDDLVRLLRQYGYQVERFAKDDGGAERAVAAQPDVLVVAGGDGTVAKAAIAVRASEIPLFILPTGTANNIARGVGVDAAVPVLIRQLPSARQLGLDIGRIAGDGHVEYFVEAVGVGFIGAMLDDQHRRLPSLWRRARGWFARDRAQAAADGVSRFVRRLESQHINIRADGDDLSGEYVGVEVMNIPSIGPRILLAPDADPGDARLDVALIRPGDRDALADQIAAQGTIMSDPPIATRRARTIELEWPDRSTHVDDERWPPRGSPERPTRVTVDICGSAHVLVPRRPPPGGWPPLLS